jgi:hypothetical protein
MTKKLLPNRSSKTRAADAMTKARMGIQLLEEAMGELTDISDEEYNALRKIADKLKRVCDDVYEIAQENIEFIEAPLTIEEITKDKLYYELCDSIFALVKAFLLRLEREQNIAGAEYYNALSVFEDDVSAKVKRGGNPKAQNVKAQLDAIDRNRGGKPGSGKGGDEAAKK